MVRAPPLTPLVRGGLHVFTPLTRGAGGLPAESSVFLNKHPRHSVKTGIQRTMILKQPCVNIMATAMASRLRKRHEVHPLDSHFRK